MYKNSLKKNNETPEKDISVIIQSYNRPDFLYEAIQSVLSQETEYNIELIVVKNYYDLKVDELLNSVGAINIKSEDDTFLGKIMEGLSHSTAKVVSFLDDDDLFTKEKVQTVVDEFHLNPRLIYYHNFFDEIDVSGNIRQSVLMKPSKDDVLINTSNTKKNKQKELYYFYSFYNTSSISIRKNEFMAYFNKHSEFRAKPLDSNFFLSACASGFDIKISNRVLNLYRLHGNNITFNSKNPQDIEYLRKDLDRQETMGNIHKGKFVYPLIQASRLDTLFISFFSKYNVMKPKFGDYILFAYFSFKRRNLVQFILISMLYFGLISRTQMAEIQESRTKKRTYFTN